MAGNRRLRAYRLRLEIFDPVRLEIFDPVRLEIFDPVRLEIFDPGPPPIPKPNRNTL
jgi:hypothetical protein